MLNGYQVGLVHTMQLDGSEANRIDVEINLNKGIRIKKDSKVKLDVSLMGNAALIVEQNQLTSDYYAFGDKIPGTRESGMLESISSVMPGVQNLFPKIDSILTDLQKLVGNPALAQTLENVNTITSDLTVSSKQLNQLMTRLNRDLPRLSGKIDTIAGDFASVTRQFESVNIESTYKSIDSTVKNMQHLTESLNSKQGSLGLLLNDRSLHDSLSVTLENASKLLEDVKENPSRYINVKVF